jgi:hypothetical protein
LGSRNGKKASVPGVTGGSRWMESKAGEEAKEDKICSAFRGKWTLIDGRILSFFPSKQNERT